MNQQMSREEMITMLAKLQADNEALQARVNAPRKVTMKVSEKGAMSLYGLGRWPVTLYKSQWQALLNSTKAIEAFLADNAALLADKPST